MIETATHMGFLDRFTFEQTEELPKELPSDLKPQKIEEGKYLIAKGEFDQTLYFGSSVVHLDHVTIHALGSREVFGEMSSFSTFPRTASIVAIEWSQVLQLSLSEFQNLHRRSPDLACALLLELGRVLTHRYRQQLKEFEGQAQS